MKTAAAYIRVSTDEQLEYSPESQIKALRDYSKRNELSLPEEYIFADEGISGKNAEKRPAFMRMISLAKSKPPPFDVILVWKFSRFARNREDSIVYKSMLRKECGIDVVSVSEQLSDDKTSILIEALIEAMDEYYSINLAEEVKRGMTEKAKRGEPQTAPPFGYTIKNGIFIINPQEGKYVKMIFDDFCAGMGYTQIAKKLNALGVHTHRGNAFENRTVEYILRNPVYIGKLRWNSSGRSHRDFDNPDIMVVNAMHEKLVSEEIFDVAQQRVAEIKKLHHKYQKPLNIKPSTWLVGLIRCAECNGAMVKNGVDTMQCNNYVHGKCFSHSVQIHALEKAVLDALYDAGVNGLEEDFVFKCKAKAETPDFSVQIKRAEQRLERISLAYQNGIDSIDEYKMSKEKIMSEINLLKKKQINRAFAEPDYKSIREQLCNAHRILHDSDALIEKKINIARKIIKSVDFSKPENTVSVTFVVS